MTSDEKQKEWKQTYSHIPNQNGIQLCDQATEKIVWKNMC